MTDPAIEAAQRHVYTLPFESRLDGADLVAAAREALAPIRELHRRNDRGECSHCISPQDAAWGAIWPCETARLVYPEDEL